jgi:hypothetical protein
MNLMEYGDQVFHIFMILQFHFHLRMHITVSYLTKT